MSGSLWHEVYPDGKISRFVVLGHTVLDGTPGTIATKDDGTMEVFIPDLGGRMTHRIRPLREAWKDYMPMEKVR